MIEKSMDALRADCFRVTGRSDAAAIFGTFFRVRTFRPMVTLRFYQGFRSRPVLGLFSPCLRVLHRLVCGASAIDLPIETRIGAGLAITHGWGLVVNSAVTIGRNVTLFHGCTLGRADSIGEGGARTSRYPVIGDGVWIGPQTVIVGGVTIGHNARIVAGSIVLADIPDRAMAAGNPAKVIKHDVERDIVNEVPLPPQ